MQRDNICMFDSCQVEEMSHQGQQLRTKDKIGAFVGSNESFPFVLHTMLDEIESQGLSHIVSWQPHGRCFLVKRRTEFVEFIMPVYFRMSKFASFQRQLNLYGFHRITTGQDQRGYYHERFLRGRKDLCTLIQRQQVKGTGVRKPASPANEPNFYIMDYMPATSRSDNNDFMQLPASAIPTSNSNSLSDIIRNSSKLASETATACSMATVLYQTPFSGSSCSGIASASFPHVAAGNIFDTSNLNNPNWQSHHHRSTTALGSAQQQQHNLPRPSAMGGIPSSMQGRAMPTSVTHSTMPSGGVDRETFNVARATAQTGVFGSPSIQSGEDTHNYSSLFSARDDSFPFDKEPPAPENRLRSGFDSDHQRVSSQYATSVPQRPRRQPSGLDRSFDNLVAALLSGTMESSSTSTGNSLFHNTLGKATEPPL